jgi:hypothetical protein
MAVVGTSRLSNQYAFILAVWWVGCEGFGGLVIVIVAKEVWCVCEWETFVLTSTSSGSTAGIAIARAWLRGIYSKMDIIHLLFEKAGLE